MSDFDPKERDETLHQRREFSILQRLSSRTNKALIPF